jgi:23S rRNA pseudouridine1911/1915/1917 synthase
MNMGGPAASLPTWIEVVADYKEPPGPDRLTGGDTVRVLADEPDADIEWRSGVVAREEHGLRLDKALVQLAPEFSRSHLQSLIARGHVRLDGQAVLLPARKLRVGQALQVELVPTEESRAFKAQAMALDILFEDAHLLVLNKPAGLVVHPAPGNWSGTLLNGLLAHHAGAAALPRAGIVHRLDKDTSGLMVVGKTLPAVTALSRAIAAREVRRQYLAVAHGVVEGGLRSIDAPIGRDPVSRVRMAVVTSGKPARTDVERLATRGAFSALRCSLHTGRTHQIRVHLAWHGHPLVSDPVYGGAPGLGLQRQALHAVHLRLCHPLTLEELRFDCPAPDDLAAALDFVAHG